MVEEEDQNEGREVEENRVITRNTLVPLIDGPIEYMHPTVQSESSDEFYADILLADDCALNCYAIKSQVEQFNIKLSFCGD